MATWKGQDGRYLFLDRDGVINRRLPGDYVRREEAFELLPGVAEAIRYFNARFERVVVVTNQQGIGKGLMTEADLDRVHRAMVSELEAAGAVLDGIYYCPHLAGAGCGCRKPASGMAWQAKEDFPEIDFSDSLMVGDSPSDLAFGRRLGMQVCWISSRVETIDLPFQPDLSFPDLTGLASFLKRERSGEAPG